jgi:two-component system cell cycle response regulator DivK
MHGDEAIRLIRWMGFDTPIIALTGNAFDSERQKLEEAGSDAFLSKPTTIEKLKTTVQAVFEAKGLGKVFPDLDPLNVNT